MVPLLLYHGFSEPGLPSANLRRRTSAGGRSKLTRDDFRPVGAGRAAYLCRPDERGVAMTSGGWQLHRVKRDEQGE